jgi:predicted SprT family Zn-dependent metalloprotease
MNNLFNELWSYCILNFQLCYDVFKSKSLKSEYSERWKLNGGMYIEKSPIKLNKETFWRKSENEPKNLTKNS